MTLYERVHMDKFSSSEILELWEQGTRLHPLDRSLLVLSAISPRHAQDVADWPLGQRNRALFELHAVCFGAHLHGWSTCPRCAEKVEFEIDDGLFTTETLPASSTDGLIIGSERYRVPTSRDLAETLSGDFETVAVRLLQRCRIGNGTVSTWTEVELRDAEEILAAADPLAETQLALDCPSCAHRWSDVLDIGGFVWAEIESRARRLLSEVHTLASAYGWSEGETLSLSSARRATYMRMVQA
jgi:hypothetical protein